MIDLLPSVPNIRILIITIFTFVYFCGSLFCLSCYGLRQPHLVWLLHQDGIDSAPC